MSDTRTVTLTEFLLARIEEDEAIAREALMTHGDVGDGVPIGDRKCIVKAFYRPPGVKAPPPANGEMWWNHSAGTDLYNRFNPARVQAECEAKRRIVAIHPSGGLDCDGDGVACPTLQALALPYADHPDYDEAWRP